MTSKNTEQKGSPHICKLCGKKEKNVWVSSMSQQLAQKQLCFRCNFWQEPIALRNDPRSVRAKGIHYFIHEDEPGSVMVGYGGRKFVVQFHDGRTVETRNLWCQGVIPERFRDQLPDNATFLNSDSRGEATKKSAGIENFLKNIFGTHRDEAVCAACHSAVSMEQFRDEISRKEFRISRMCQECQDDVFEPEPW